MNNPLTLRITEIFYSLQGESNLVGLPTVFVRLTGCPLRCQYCDTAYAFSGGAKQTLDKIIENIQKYNTKYITITGGEPLAQKNVATLMQQLCDLGYTVSIETSGAFDISPIDPRVIKVMDIKTPDSLEHSKNKLENIDFLTKQDQVKFVICSQDDYTWSKDFIKKYNLAEKTQVLFSHSYNQLPAQQLAQWILDDQLPVRFQTQLHKQLWGDKIGV